MIALVIRPNYLEGTLQLLDTLGLEPYSITNVEGVGRQRGHTEIYRGGEYGIHTLPKIRVEILVNDPGKREEVIQHISDFVRTGRVGDGKIFVFHGESTPEVEA